MKRSTSSDDTNVSNVVLSSDHEDKEQSSSTSFAEQASNTLLAVFTHASRNDLKNANKFWHLKDELLCYKENWYVSSELIRRLLLKQNHDDSHANHFEVKRTLDLLQRKYFWSAMNQDVKDYVNHCETYHRIKIIKHKSFKQLQSILMLKESR
jgi:hypothetical protein